MAAAQGIIKINTLLSPNDGDVLTEVKKKLFYLIAYCDTYHDFSSDRPVLGEGKSVSKSDVGNRSEYIKNMITKMEGAEAGPFIQLIDELKPAKGYTFENKVGIEFSSLPKSKILEKFAGPTTPAEEALAQENGGANDMTDRGKIRNYLYEINSLPPGSNQQYQCLKQGDFKAASPPIGKASLIDIYIPAANYSDEIVPNNLINFLYNVFPECHTGGVLKFVEDAASFPRELFTGRLGQFRKIVTTQTKWDPAGLSLSHFEANNTVNTHNVMAPSFLAAQPSSIAINQANLIQNYFNQATDTLIREGQPPRSIKKAGPSVNHLFMHMIIEKDGLPEAVKNKYKQLIKVAKLDSKKNLVEPLLPDAGEGDNSAKGGRLRKLTTSKRTGDYENIHSAIEADALMFTGDEAAFTYAKLNKCPAVYHINTRGFHTFKLYIPPPRDAEENKKKIRENLTTGLLLQCLELRTTFGATAEFYNNYLTNLRDVVFSGNITVAGSPEVGRLLQSYFIREFNDNRDFFNNLKLAHKLYNNLGLAALVSEATIRTYSYDRLETLVKQAVTTINELEDKNKAINLKQKMINIKKKIPSRFTGSLSAVGDFNLFRAFTDEDRGDGFLVKVAASAAASIKYSFEPGTFFPEYKYLESSFEGIARYLRINQKTTNESLIAKNNRIIQGVLDDFGIYRLPAEGELDDSIRNIVSQINGLLAPNPVVAQEGGKRNIKTQVKRLNNSKSRTVKNHYNSHYYSSLHSKISTLNPSIVPFGFTPEEYADILVYRIIINNCINKINMQSISENSTEIITKNPESTQYAIQTAGGLRDYLELHDYCVFLYTNSIEPFLRKHLFTDRINLEGGAGEVKYTPEIVHQNILLSIVGGSYFEDLEVLLGDIISSPDFSYLGNKSRSSPLYFHNMIDTAVVAINSVFTKIHTSHKTPNYNIKCASHQGAMPGGIELPVKDIIVKYNEYLNKEIYDDTFFEYLSNICNFLNNIILTEKNKKELVLREVAEAELNATIETLPAGDNSLSIEAVKTLWPLLQNYMKYAINDYIEFGDFSAKDGQDGGSFKMKPKIHRRKRNGSPRRKSLRRK